MKKIALILLVTLSLFSCNKEEGTKEEIIDKPCYKNWTKDSKSKTYIGGTVSITDRITNETCTFTARLTLGYSYSGVFSGSILGEANSLFDYCSYPGASGIFKECRLDFLVGEKQIDNTFRETLSIVRDSNSFEGAGQIFKKDNSGNEILVADMIFSVPF